MFTLFIYFFTIQVGEHNKIDDNSQEWLLYYILTNAAIIILAAIMKNRTRPLTADLFNIVANSHMWQLNFKYKLALNNIRIQFLCYTRHILQ